MPEHAGRVDKQRQEAIGGISRKALYRGDRVVKCREAGVWWLRSPYANNNNKAGVVNNNGNVNNNNVKNDWAARPALPYRPKWLPGGLHLRRPKSLLA